MTRNTTQNLNLPKKMKTARILFTLVGIGTLNLGLSYADELSKQPTEQVLHENHSTSDPSSDPAHAKLKPTEEKILEPKDDGHASKKIGRAEAIKTDPERKPGDGHRETDPKRRPDDDFHKTNPKRKPGDDVHKTDPKHKPGDELHQPNLKKSATAAKEGPMIKKVGNPHDSPAKLPFGNEVVGLRPGVIRSRGATAALVGRVLVTSNTKFSAGPLDAAVKQGKP
jgi:hypothetical protein